MKVLDIAGESVSQASFIVAMQFIAGFIDDLFAGV